MITGYHPIILFFILDSFFRILFLLSIRRTWDFILLLFVSAHNTQEFLIQTLTLSCFGRPRLCGTHRLNRIFSPSFPVPYKILSLFWFSFLPCLPICTKGSFAAFLVILAAFTAQYVTCSVVPATVPLVLPPQLCFLYHFHLRVISSALPTKMWPFIWIMPQIQGRQHRQFPSRFNKWAQAACLHRLRRMFKSSQTFAFHQKWPCFCGILLANIGHSHWVICILDQLLLCFFRTHHSSPARPHQKCSLHISLEVVAGSSKVHQCLW